MGELLSIHPEESEGGPSQRGEWMRNIWILETVKVETIAAANRPGGERQGRGVIIFIGRLLRRVMFLS